MTKFISILLVVYLSLAGACFAGNPFLDLLNPPSPSEDSVVAPPEDTSTMPRNAAYLYMYEGDWMATIVGSKTIYSADITKDQYECNGDKSQCCGWITLRKLGSTEGVIKWKFCLNSTYEAHIKDVEGTFDIMCVGIRGALTENPLHPQLPGFAVGDPSLMICTDSVMLGRPQ